MSGVCLAAVECKLYKSRFIPCRIQDLHTIQHSTVCLSSYPLLPPLRNQVCIDDITKSMFIL